MLEYYLYLMSIGVFTAETAFLAPGQKFRHLPVLRKAIADSLFDETHFFALMAGSTGRLRLNTKHLKLREEPEAFAEKAFRALRQYLKRHNQRSEIDPLIVLDVHAMMLFATYVMDYTAARAHLSMMVHTVNRLPKSRKHFPRTLHQG